MSKIKININASMLKNTNCFRRTWLDVIKGYKEPLNTNDIEFGSAFHLFKSTLTQTGDQQTALAAARDYYARPMTIAPKKDYMTVNYLMSVCMDYYLKYKNDTFQTIINLAGNKHLCELKFEWPYYEDDEVQVMLCGTIDDICQGRNTCVAIRDFKTTSSYDTEKYFAPYELSTQLHFYLNALHLYGKKFPNTIFGELVKKPIGCFIDGVFLRGKTQPPEFRRSKMYIYTPERMLEFNLLLATVVAKIVAQVKSYSKLEELPPREGMINNACSSNFGCKYLGACSSPDQISFNHILNNNFIQKEYDPLSFHD